MLTAKDLVGVFPATVTPMTPDYEVEEEDLRNHVKQLSSIRGVGALVPNAHSGEGRMVTREQRIQVIKVHKEASKVPIIAGIAGESTLTTIELMQDAKDAGADAIMLLPPQCFTYGYLPVEVVYKYYNDCSNAVDIPIVAFQFPGFGGVKIPVEGIVEACNVKNVIGIKEASFNPVIFEETARRIRALPKEISLITGNDTFLYTCYLIGVDAALILYANLVTEMHVEMFEAVKKGNLTKGKEIDDRMRDLTNFVFGPPERDLIVRIKEALVMLGTFKYSTVLPPQPPINEEEKQKLRKILRDLGLRLAVESVARSK
jgi:4-hydroxy-tetrahydrodipicolinate synthase